MFKDISKKNTYSNKGFTLVELLVVVVIISILTGVILSVLNVSGMRAKSRDSQRKTDLSKIKAALELYFTDNRRYPSSSASGTWINIASASALSTALVSGGYIDVLPRDPSYTGTPPSDPCSRPGSTTAYRYNYISPVDGSRYILAAVMEVSSSDDESKCSDLSNWSATVCGASSGSQCGCTGYTTTAPDICYGIQNPF
jgi:type II secretion system protein G